MEAEETRKLQKKETKKKVRSGHKSATRVVRRLKKRGSLVEKEVTETEEKRRCKKTEAGHQPPAR